MEELFLNHYRENEKIAFLGVVSSLAIADNKASQEELDIISSLADESRISGPQKEKILAAAKGLSGSEMDQWLDDLKNSELRFSLITELISFAQSDGNYHDQEKQKIEEISTRLGINNNQFSLLDNFVTKSNESINNNENAAAPGFLEKLGLGNLFNKAGISLPGMSKGLLAIAAPILLSKLFGSVRGRMTGSKGALGGMLGTAGLSSLLGMLSGGRGFSQTGGLLSKLFKKA